MRSNGRNLALFQYADDALFLGKWSFNNISNLLKLLNCFYDVSGLKINLSKSSLFCIGIEDSMVKAMVDHFNCNHGKMPFTYLGLSVGGNMHRKSTWAEVINKISKKKLMLEGRSITIGGRLTLINSVISTPSLVLLFNL